MTIIITRNVYAYLGGAWVDISTDVLHSPHQNAKWGIDGNKPLDRIAKAGTLSFSMDNSQNKYTPNGASVIHADWGKGTKIKYTFTFEGEERVKFYGTIDRIRIDAGLTSLRKVHVTVVDWLDYSAKHPLKNPAIAQNKRADEALTQIVDAMPIQPQARSFSTGVNTFPIVFNEATQKTRAYSEFQKLVTSELGRLYLKKDATYGETLVFEASTERPLNTPLKQVTQLTTPGFLLKEDGGYLLKEDGGKIYIESFTTSDVTIDNEMRSMDIEYGTNLLNRVSLTVNPTKIDTTPSLLYELDNPIFIDTNTEKTFDVQFTEASSKRLVAALSPDGATYPQTLLHFDGTKNGRIIYDEAGHLWETSDIQIVNNIKKIGAGSAYMDGTGAYIYSLSSADYELDADDFTIEWWEYRFSAATGPAMISRTGGSGFSPFILGQSNGSSALIYMSSDGATWDIANGKTLGAIVTDTWVHYAVTRSGSTFKSFNNGSQTDTWTSSAAILASTSALHIGKNNTSYITACIDEFRIIKGEARYTASFTPPTTELTLSGIVLSAWTNEGGIGTELTNDFVLTDVYGGAGATLTIRNNSLLGGWLTKLKIYSYIVESVNPITKVQEDADSINAYGYNEISINQVYQQDLVNATEEAAKILEDNRAPAVVLNSVTMDANKNANMMLYFLNVDVGDLVGIIEDQTEVSGRYFVQGVEFDVTGGADGVIVQYKWNLINLSRLTELYVEFGTSSPYAYVNYGYVPPVCADTVTERVFSFWIGSVNVGSGSVDNGVFLSTNFNNYGFRIATSQTRIYFSYYGDGNSNWRTNTVSVDVNNRINVVVYYDKSSTTNEPIFYINGVLASSSISGTNTLTAMGSEAGSELLIGDYRSSTIGTGFTINKKIRDVRIYNASTLTDLATLAADIYTAGPGVSVTTNAELVFNTFSVQTNSISEYIDVALSEEQKLLDSVGFYVGTPVNSPTARAV